MRFLLSIIVLFFVCSAFHVQAQTQATPIVLLYESGSSDSDKAFIDMAISGAKRAHNELGLPYESHVIANGDTREQLFREYAEKGTELIIALGFQNVSSVMKVAKEYPQTSFTVIDGNIPPVFSNVQSISFRDHEGAFLVGMIAALHTKNNTIGFIGGMDVPVIRDFAYGYRQGAEYVNPEITVLQDMIGTTNEAWSNPKKASTLAQRQIAQGADVIFAAAGGSSVGMLEKVSQYSNVYGIGVDTNQNGSYPGSVLTSLVKRVDKAVYNTIAQRSDNSWSPGVQTMGIAEGALDYAIDVNNRDLFTKDMIDRVERTKDYITRNLIRVDPYRAQQ